MRIGTFLVGVAITLVATTLSAATPSTPTPVPARPGPVLCAPGVKCSPYKHQLSVPAHALSYTDSAAFALHHRGINWLAKPGMMTFTVHRPKDFPAGGKIRLTVFHQVYSDAPGTIQFTIEPMAFNSGNSFETYGSQGTNTVPAPESPTIMLQQSVVIAPGNGWNPNNDWWYFELKRQGTFEGGLRVMSVAIDY